MANLWRSCKRDPFWQHLWNNSGLVDDLPSETVEKIRQKIRAGNLKAAAAKASAPADGEMTPEKPGNAVRRVQTCRPAVSSNPVKSSTVLQKAGTVNENGADNAKVDKAGANLEKTGLAKSGGEDQQQDCEEDDDLMPDAGED